MALQSWVSLHGTDPNSLSRHQQGGQMWCKGIGADNNWYAIEVDPATGQIPVTTTGASPVLDFGPTNVAPRSAAVIGNTTGLADFDAGNYSAQTLRVVIATNNPPLPVSVSGGALDFGASAAAQRSAALLGNTTGEADFNAGVTGAQTLRVVLPTDQTPIPVNVVGGGGIASGGAQAVLNITNTPQLVSTQGAVNLAGRTVLTACNTSVDILYWGYSNAVTTTDGTPITQYQVVTWDITDTQDVWAVSAGSSNTRITEAI